MCEGWVRRRCEGVRGGVCEGTFLRGHDVPRLKVGIKFFLAYVDNIVPTPQTIVCGFLCEQERERESE